MQQVQQRAEALAELDRAKTAFFSNISHKFRTPRISDAWISDATNFGRHEFRTSLTLILGPAVDLLSNSLAALIPCAADPFKAVNRNGLQLLRMNKSLLNFSRIEAGRIGGVYQPVAGAAVSRTARRFGSGPALWPRHGQHVYCAPPLALSQLVGRQIVDVVLLDIGLPKLHGYDVSRRLRQQIWSKGLFIIALTRWGQVDDRRQSAEAGFGSHLVKPLTLADLENH